MQSNKEVRGAAIFSEKEHVRDQSLRVYTYLVCRSHSRNYIQEGGDKTRIFQQKDITLSKMKMVLGMDERTIKKYWRMLEESKIIKFQAEWNNAKEELFNLKQNFLEKKGIKAEYADVLIEIEKLKPADKDKLFIEEWKLRNKHKDCYYEIPLPQYYRKVPEKTLIFLNEILGLNELTLKIYITMISLQEETLSRGWGYWKFTYSDICQVLDYTPHMDTIKRIQGALVQLEGLKLIEYDIKTEKNSKGATQTFLLLRNVNFYLENKIFGIEISEDVTFSPDLIQCLKEKVRDYEKVLK